MPLQFKDCRFINRQNEGVLKIPFTFKKSKFLPKHRAMVKKLNLKYFLDQFDTMMIRE